MNIFIILGEAYIGIVVGAQEQAQVAIVQLLGACSCHPAHAVAKQTSHFWYLLSARLVDMQRTQAGQRAGKVFFISLEV
jgi:hypothetical protein